MKNNRIDWPSGPWDNEPDELEWIYADQKCLVVRCGGHLNGYVCVEPWHPFFKKDYNDPLNILIKKRDEMLDKPMPENPSFSLMLSALGGNIKPTMANVIDVHGGVTFADKMKNRKGWWIGFDTGHHGDAWPDKTGYFVNRGIYRDIDYVKNQTELLADQIIEIGKLK